MNKVFKVIGTLIKWYLRITIGVLALIGVGQLLKKADEYPELTPLEIDELTIEETIENYKDFYRMQ